MIKIQEISNPIRIQLTIYGYLYKRARQMIGGNPILSSQLIIHPAVSYAASHVIAERADILMGIGIFCDVRHPQSIQQGILKLSAHYSQFTQSYLDHDTEITE